MTEQEAQRELERIRAGRERAKAEEQAAQTERQRRADEAAASVESLYRQCNVCRRNIWDTYTEKDRQSARDFARWSYLQIGRVMVIGAICNRCAEAQAKQALEDARVERFRSLASQGLVPGNLMRYSKPPQRLVAKNPDAWRIVGEWQPHQGNVLAFGPEGVGKSSLCRAILCKAIDMRRMAQEVASADIEAFWWRIDYEHLLSRAQYVGLLLVDDIGNVPWTPRGLNLLRSLIDFRHENRKDTLYTSNMDTTALHAKLAAVMNDEVYATSLLRRLRPLKILHMVGDSFRLDMEYGQNQKEEHAQ